MSNTFTGNVGSVELKHTPQGKPVLEVAFAENFNKKDQSGQWQKDGEPTWRRATLWEEKALDAAEVIQKGDRIVVVGRERLREYTAKDGSIGKSLEVQAQIIAKVPPRLQNGQQSQSQPAQQWGNQSQQGQGDPWSGGQQQAAGDWGTTPAAGSTPPPF